MKILVCGLGSIGERHIRNLLDLGYDDIITYRKKNLPLRTLEREFPVYFSLDEALEQCPDIALVCNPTSLHYQTALACLEGRCHVFVEKPLNDSSEGLEQITMLAKKMSRQVMVGYMMRFHPCLQKIQDWLGDGAIGRLIHVRSQWGEYLPDWHPWEDYRNSYAALRSMGGGPGLTLSHELDTLIWLCGEYEKVVANANHSSDLEVDTEHGIDFLITFKSGVTANVHMDYYQSPPSRTMELVGTTGRINFDYYLSRADLYKMRGNSVEEMFDVSKTFDRNDLFVLELQYFLNAIANGNPVKPGIEDGYRVIRLLEGAMVKEK